MRWIPFVILAYLVIVLQTSLGRLLTIQTPLGLVGPDFAAVVAVFLALHARSSTEAMLAAWTLGFALDLTTGSVAGEVSAAGPMALTYALAAGLVFQIREAVFRERAVTQVMTVLLFCVLAHGLWITVQSLRVGLGSWDVYGRMLLQSLGIGVYTGMLGPLGCAAMSRGRRWWLPAASGRGRS
jgi:rod shape-determining protein MreD